jgi:hypothetical protein
VTAVAPPPPRGLRPLVALVVIALFVMLPALVAGAGIDAPVQQAERDRLAVPEGTARSIPAELFYRATLPDTPDLRVTDRVVAQARLAPVLALAGIGLLLYVLLALGRARLTGLLACAVLALLPPVADEGFLLRPEPAAVLAGLLGVVLLAAMATVGIRPGTRVRTQLPFLFAASVAFGIAAAILPAAGLFLLVPLGAFELSVLLAGTRLRRLLRRAPLEQLPWRAWHRRHVPWLLAVAGALLATWLFMSRYIVGPVADLQPSAAAVTMAPPAWYLRVPLLLLALLGALRLLLATGRQLSLHRRITPPMVLLLFVATQLARDLLRAEGLDQLGGAIALAVLVAEGAGLLLWLGLGLALRERVR